VATAQALPLFHLIGNIVLVAPFSPYYYRDENTTVMRDDALAVNRTTFEKIRD